ncbi:MAG: hypothetical protein KatS3mg113_0905 [Planctomycetaceae bacterium]|nr:MAG: hypothetical protein KatS3mg113_0905 [Planctomycetaceae bacterium]
MLTRQRIYLALFLSILCLQGLRGSAESKVATQSSPLRAAACAIDITPPRFPISVNGGMSDRQAQAAHDPLHARCLVLANAHTQLVLMVCDSCMIPREIIDSARHRAAYRTGIPADHMLISATHAHSCPTVGGVFQSDPDPDYVLYLSDKMVEAIECAHHKLVPAEMGWITTEDHAQVFNRRWLLKEGILAENPFGQRVDRVKMNPGFGNTEVSHPAGPVDPQISVIAVRTLDGKPLAILANYGLHYVGGVPGQLLSADYFGEFALRLNRLIGGDRANPPCVVMMTNGTSGDVNNIDYRLQAAPQRAPFEQIGVVAESVARKVAEALPRITYRSHVTLASVQREITWGVRKPSAEEVQQARAWLAEAPPGRPLQGVKLIYARETVLLDEYPHSVTARIQALRIDDLAIVSSPCETFAETGLAIKKGSPFRHTFVIELANGYNGYLPTPEHHALGGYETWRARSSYLAVDAEPLLRQTWHDLLRELSASGQP